MRLFWKIFGNPETRFLKRLSFFILQINSLEMGLSQLDSEQLKSKTQEFKERLAKGESLDEILPEAFTLVREAAKRTLNQRHFDVQLLGGIVLHQGKIAEMKTGEGKTLTATLAVYLNALEGKGVHVVTVNDYLAKRDTVWMGQIYRALGLSIGCITHEASYLYDSDYVTKEQEALEIKNQKSKIKNNDLDKERDITGGFKIEKSYLRPVSRKEAYAADITYGTNNEFGFDYLRDNLAYDSNQISQREFHYAIVDEIDSILIDEARTPLIISAPDAESTKLYERFSKISLRLTKEKDYKIDDKMKAATLTDEGIKKIEGILGFDIYSEPVIGFKYVHHLQQALRAQTLFKRDRDYVVRNGEVIIVDEFTGRLMIGRRYSEGLHQALEAKEGVHVRPESRTLASITFQNYFRMYKKLAGMTGTAATSAEEFHKVYNLEVVSIPTHQPMIREDKSDAIYKTEKAKFAAIVDEVKQHYEKGQPVLVGTVSIEKNEHLSSLLKRAGIVHEILNAKQHEKEGEIIAQAGKFKAVTVATNMAGRGVDIILGGNPQNLEQSRRVVEVGGLHVIGTERHEARRIDNQLRGRSGRQGDSGSSQFFVSLEDDLMRIFGGQKIKNLMERFNFPEDQPIENKMLSKAIESAQAKIEGFNFDIRKHVLEYDEVMNKQREVIYKKRLEFLGKGDITRLRILDFFWMEHLENMDHLRDSVRLRAYGQREPLIEYKNEGHKMFQDLLRVIEENVLRQTQDGEQGRTIEKLKKEEISNDKLLISNQTPMPNTQIRNSQPKVGRNDPCPCGAINPETGQAYKYKKCGLINAPYHKK